MSTDPYSGDLHFALEREPPGLASGSARAYRARGGEGGRGRPLLARQPEARPSHHGARPVLHHCRRGLQIRRQGGHRGPAPKTSLHLRVIKMINIR